MASSNDTIVDTSQLTHDDLLEVYEKLANSYKNTKTELDIATQKFHSEYQQRKIFENSQNDLQSELDQINLVHAQILKESEKKVEELKEKNLQLTMEKSSLESKIDETSLAISNLKTEVEGLKDMLAKEKTIKPRISNTYSQSLEVENDQLRNQRNDLEIQLEDVKEKLCEFTTEIVDYREKIKCLEDNVESKKVELEEKNETIEQLQEKMHEMSTELATLRNASISDDGNRKGNSLFAEVDEQRQKMKKMLQGERHHYIEMRKNINAKEIEVRRLKRENLNIKSEIQSCSALFNRGESLLSQNLSLHLAQIEGEKKSLESQLNEMEMKLIDMAKTQRLDWIETMMTSASKEVREMKDKIFVLTREKISVIDNNSKNMKELARAKLDVVKYKTMLGRLVDEFKIRIDPKKYYDIGINEEFLEHLKIDDDFEFEQSVISNCEDEESKNPSMECNLNESTIALLGGRERLGSALPESAKAPNEFSFNIAASSSRVDMSSTVQDEKPTFDALPSGVKSTFEFQKPSNDLSSNAVTSKENTTMPLTTSTIKYRPISVSSISSKNVLQETVSKKNETADASQAQPTRKRAPIVVKKIIIPSKVQKKDANVTK